MVFWDIKWKNKMMVLASFREGFFFPWPNCIIWTDLKLVFTHCQDSSLHLPWFTLTPRIQPIRAPKRSLGFLPDTCSKAALMLLLSSSYRVNANSFAQVLRLLTKACFNCLWRIINASRVEFVPNHERTSLGLYNPHHLGLSQILSNGSLLIFLPSSMAAQQKSSL